MAIKALKQNVSIREIQKMIHQWKNRGINDPTVTKLYWTSIWECRLI